QRVVLPARSAARVAGESSERQPREGGELSLECTVPAGFVDHVEWLVEPDRDLRLQAANQPVGEAALGLGQRPWAGVLLVAALAEASPVPGEVAIEVDAVRVLPGSRGDAVR